LVGKPRVMRAQIQINAALILVAGWAVASRVECPLELKIIPTQRTQRMRLVENQIHQTDYENVVAWCRSVMWFQLPLSVHCTEEMQQVLVRANMDCLTAQAKAILLDPNIRDTVEVVAATLIRAHEIKDHRGTAFQILTHLEKGSYDSSYINGCPADSYEEWNRSCRELRALSG